MPAHGDAIRPKRRKWWIIALSLALLAACVGLWKWSEPPGFAFLASARLVDMQISPNGWLYRVYESDRDYAEVSSQASLELGWSTDAGSSTMAFVQGDLKVAIDARLIEPHSVKQPSRITISRPANFADPVLVGIFRFFRRGGEP